MKWWSFRVGPIPVVHGIEAEVLALFEKHGLRPPCMFSSWTAEEFLLPVDCEEDWGEER